MTSRAGAVGVGAALLAAVCCAAVPLAASVLGGLALTAWLGVAGAIIAIAVLTLVVVVHVRRRADAPLARRDLRDPDRQ